MPEYFVPNPPSAINDVQLREEVREVFPGALLNLKSSGIMRVTTINTLDTNEQATLATIIENHEAVDWQAIEKDAEQEFGDIPNWAHWTIDQGLTWHDDNIKARIDQLQIDIASVTNLATALPVMQEMLDVIQLLATQGRAEGWGVLALRNKVFPNLEGSNGS